MSISRIAHELVDSTAEIFSDKLYKRFADLPNDKQLEVIAKTVVVAFTAGLLSAALFSTGALAAIVSGAVAFSYFSRNVPVYSEAFELKYAANETVNFIDIAFTSFVKWTEK